MIKTLAKAQQQERVKFRVPRSVQDAIPIRRIWSDGIFLCGNQYSKTWSFTDINYAIAGKDDKTAMFLDYSELLNALDSGASAKITLCNRRVNKAEFERSVLLPMKGDTLDEYRREFNEIMVRHIRNVSGRRQGEWVPHLCADAGTFGGVSWRLAKAFLNKSPPCPKR